MPSNLGFELSILANNDSYVPLHPKTTVSQVIDWKMGEVVGPYVLELSAAGWTNKQQTLSLNGITPDDIPYCLKILEGTEEQMAAQQEAYALIDPKVGIESLQNAVRFTCTDAVPTVDIKVQVHWYK